MRWLAFRLLDLASKRDMAATVQCLPPRRECTPRWARRFRRAPVWRSTLQAPLLIKVFSFRLLRRGVIVAVIRLADAAGLKQDFKTETKSKAIAIAASAAGAVAKRFQAVEAEASRIHAEQSGAQLVRALLQGGKLPAIVSDGKSTIEVCNGRVALPDQSAVLSAAAEAVDAESAYHRVLEDTRVARSSWHIRPPKRMMRSGSWNML